MKTATEMKEISKQNAERYFAANMHRLNALLKSEAYNGRTFCKVPREVMTPGIQERLILLGYEVQLVDETALIAWDS